ncbi:MAG: Mu-like prophage major head subunit gpT family protein [Pseudomonadota bacterium]
MPDTLQSLDTDKDSNVFLSDEYLYGMRARVNAGFGLWQLAFGSKAQLTIANYAAARAPMQARRYNGGRIMGLAQTLLVVPPSLESAARRVLIAPRNAAGATNVWADSAELLVTPFLAA